MCRTPRQTNCYRLANAYVREGRADTVIQAEDAIRQELQDIYRVFDTIDRQLDVIGETQIRIERKIHTIVRYMDLRAQSRSAPPRTDFCSQRAMRPSP